MFQRDSRVGVESTAYLNASARTPSALHFHPMPLAIPETPLRAVPVGG